MVLYIASREAMSLAKFGIKVSAASSVDADGGPRDCMSGATDTPAKKRRAIAKCSQTDGCAVAGSPASPLTPIKVAGQLLRCGGDSSARSAPDASGPPPALRPTCQAHDTEPADDPDTPCLGVKYRGIFFNFVDYDGKPLSSMGEEGVRMFVQIGYEAFRSLRRNVEKKRTPGAVAARVPSWRETHTFDTIKRGISAHYGKHTRRQWKRSKQPTADDVTYEVQIGEHLIVVTPLLTHVRMVYTHESFVRAI